MTIGIAYPYHRDSNSSTYIVRVHPSPSYFLNNFRKKSNSFAFFACFICTIQKKAVLLGSEMSFVGNVYAGKHALSMESICAEIVSCFGNRLWVRGIHYILKRRLLNALLLTHKSLEHFCKFQSRNKVAIDAYGCDNCTCPAIVAGGSSYRRRFHYC